MIPFLDLKAQLHQIGPELADAAQRVVLSGHYVLGPEVKAFEREFATYCQSTDCVGVNSGTAALVLALRALDIGAGDEVITVPLTFVATVAAIENAGAKPIFVDVDPVTWTMDPTKIEAAITPRTKAIVPVHLHGLCAEMDNILAIARKHGLKVIEDACQAHGAEYKGRRAGSLGDLGAFSFYPGKNLGACGEGGAVTGSNPELLQKVRILRDWGQDRKYHHVEKGYNARLDELQAALLRIKLRHLEQWTEGRRLNAQRYAEGLGDVAVRPQPPSHCRHVYHVYSLCTDNRDAIAKTLGDAGVATGIHYPVPVHLQPAWADLGHKKGDFPISERIAAELLSLPMFAELSAEQISQVCVAVRKAIA